MRKTTIITGANGNIGSAIAAKLMEKGGNTVLVYHQNQKRITALEKEYPQNSCLLKADIRSPRFGELLYAALAERKWTADSLVHTAAIRSYDHKSLADSNPDIWREVIETNLIGSYNVLKGALRCFASSTAQYQDGLRRIVLFGSDVSRIGLPYGSAYAASKAAISNISRSLCVELSKDMILINTISPGPVDIDDSAFPEEYRKFRQQYYQDMLKKIPLKRFALPADIAALTLFLISDDNRYITGEEFFLTGGKV